MAPVTEQTMYAVVLTGPERLEIQERPVPAPEAGEVLVAVGAVGICGSDLHAFHGQRPGMEPPIVLGHECAGRVVAVGPGVSPDLVGQTVAVIPMVACGACRTCRRGWTNICPHRQFIGGNLPGGFAQYLRAPVRNVVPLPAALTGPASGVVEPVSVITHLFDRVLAGLPGPVAIFGAGFLGLVSLQVARRTGAPFVAISDVRPERLALARDLGASLVIDSRTEDPVAVLRQQFGPEGVPLVIDAAGITATRQQALAVAGPGATVGLLGFSDMVSPLDFVQIVRKELRLVATYASTAEDFERAAAWLATGFVTVEGLITACPLRSAPAVLPDLVAGRLPAVKVVLLP